LDDAPDEESGPLMRDCSCRGNSAGFAHISCITKYAESKLKQVEEKGWKEARRTRVEYVNNFGEVLDSVDFWKVCPSCKQPYQHELAIGVANSALSFIEENYSGNDVPDNMLVIEVLKIKVEAILTMDGDKSIENLDLRLEGREAADRLLSLSEETRAMLPQMTAFIIRGVLANTEGTRNVLYNKEIWACNQIANFILMEETKECYEEAIGYYERVRDTALSLGMESKAEHTNDLITSIRLVSNGAFSAAAGTFQETVQSQHDQTLLEKGENCAEAVQSGLNVAIPLMESNRIEAQRLLEKLVTSSRRVHGPTHDQTRKIEKLLKRMKLRLVVHIKGEQLGEDEEIFRALRYVDDGNKFVVQGPVHVLSGVSLEKFKGKRKYKVGKNSIFFVKGTIVSCHGLENATNLNGKLGTVQSIDLNDGLRYGVHFEDESLNPPAEGIKHENLCIVFDLLDVE
jgi:hypothetical protein